MRSAGDISLPLHVTNETAHHKVRGLSWVTVSWFFLRDISVEFFPEVFLVALSTTSSVPSSSSVFQKRADISTIDILKTSPKQPRWRLKNSMKNSADGSSAFTDHILSHTSTHVSAYTSHTPFSKLQTDACGLRLSPATFKTSVDLGSQFKDLKGTVFPSSPGLQITTPAQFISDSL